MIHRIYQIVFLIFVIESIILILGIQFGFFTYGREIGTPLMKLGIIIGLGLAFIFWFILRKNKWKYQFLFESLLIIIMIFLSLYYLLEDQFQIHI